jgi:hypothetical protein
MLVNNIKVGSVYSWKMNSGEELIGKVLEVTDTTVKLQEPVSVAPGPQGMGLMPSLFTADAEAEFILNLNCVALVAITADSVKAKYIEATTGLKIPEKKLILG